MAKKKKNRKSRKNQHEPINQESNPTQSNTSEAKLF